MKKLRTKTIKKSIETWSLFEGCPVKLRVTKEDDKIKDTRLVGKGPHNSHPMLVNPEFSDILNDRNPWAEFDSKGKYVGYGWKGVEIDLKDVYSGEVEVTSENLLFAYTDGHLIFDMEGNPIPRVHTFNYIGSPFSNEYCDLEPMLDYLKSHPWIINPEDLEISSVPYYNNEGGWKKCIGGENGLVHILPPKEVYKEIYESSKGDEFFSTKMKERIHSGAPYDWGTERNKDVKDYMKIWKFHKPKKERS